MPMLNKPGRTTMIVLFVLLTLPCLTYLSLSVRMLFWLWPVDTALRAVPLYLAILFDGAFLDGGELSPSLVPLWVAMTGLLLWPLLALGIRPVLWVSLKWRKVILGYGATAAVCTVAASCWIFTHTGYLF